MNIIMVCFLFALQIFIFFASGIILCKFIHLNISSITLTFFAGFIFYFCIFGIIAIPMILLSFPLSSLTYTMMAITLLLVIVAIILYRKQWFLLPKNILTATRQHSYMIIPLSFAVLFIEIVIFNHIDWSADASYYIGKVTTDVYTNTMGHYDPYTGNKLQVLDSRRIFACFPEYNAVISQFFQIHPLKQAKLIIPQIMALFTCILYYQIGLRLFHGNKKKADCLVCITILLDFFSNTIYTNSTFLLTRTYEGKSILANIIIPGMIYCFIVIWQTHESSYMKLLFAISLCSCFISSSSMLIIPVGLTAGLIPWILKEKSWKNIKFYIACILPNLIICVCYLLAVKGYMIYTIE